MNEQKYEKLKNKYNVNTNSIKSMKHFIHSLVEDIEDVDYNMVSFVYSMLNKSTKKFGNEMIYEFEYILNENPDLTFVLFTLTVFNPSIDQSFKSTFFSKMNNMLGDALDNFTISNNSYFKEMSDKECSNLTEFIKNNFHDMIVKPLYSDNSSAVVYQLNGVNIDELIYNEFIDFTLLKNNIYRTEFNVSFNKLEFSDLMDELEENLTSSKNVFIHSGDIYGYLLDFEYDNGGIFDYVNFDGDEAYSRSFDDSRFQSLMSKTLRRLLERKITDFGIKTFDHDILDLETTVKSSIIIRGISDFIKKELERFTDKFKEKFFDDIDVNGMLQIDFEIVEHDSIQTAKQFLLTLLILINIHSLLNLDPSGYKSRRFILRSIIFKIHLLGVKLIDYGTCIFEPKMTYKPFDWSDIDA